MRHMKQSYFSYLIRLTLKLNLVSSLVNYRFRILRSYLLRLHWQTTVAGSRLLKRSADILVSGLILLLGLPVFLFIGLAIWINDRGPIFYWQKRVGMFGEEFNFPKFRTMVTNAEALKASLMKKSDLGESLTFKMKQDPRVTWIGRFLRRFSMDELPQLWCVFVGKMSLVGPRPPIPSEVSKYSVADRRRLDVPPGLTCIWQVTGRSDIPFEGQVRLDREYIDNRSIFLDLKLLAMTIPAVITGRGAY